MDNPTFLIRLIDFLQAQNKIKLVFLFGVFLVLSALSSVGWLQPDEHARVMEPAHQLVYGFATLPWEFSQSMPLVSYLLAVIHAPILFVTKSLHLSGLQEAAVLRLFAGVICSTKILSMYWILRSFNFTGRALVMLMLLFVLGPYGPVMLVRTSQENYGVTALLASVAIFLHFKNITGKYLPAFFVGFLLALSVSFRLQIGVTALFLGFYMLRVFADRRALMFLLGCLAGFVPLAIVDYYTFKTPFLPAWNYFKYALSDEDGATAWGSENWYWYFKEFFTTWFPPLSPLLLIFALKGLKEFFLLQVLVIPYLIIHVILGHKEMRYMAPILPWIFIATALGFYSFRFKGQKFCDYFFHKLAVSKGFRTITYTLLGVYFFVGIGAALIPLNTSPLMYDAIGNLYRSGEAAKGILYVGNTASGVSEFYTKVDDIPYRHIPTDDYLERLRSKKWKPEAPRIHAFYAFHSSEVDEASKFCEVSFFSGSPWLKNFFDLLPNGIQKPRYHGILKCPSGV